MCKYWKKFLAFFIERGKIWANNQPPSENFKIMYIYHKTFCHLHKNMQKNCLLMSEMKGNFICFKLLWLEISSCFMWRNLLSLPFFHYDSFSSQSAQILPLEQLIAYISYKVPKIVKLELFSFIKEQNCV